MAGTLLAATLFAMPASAGLLDDALGWARGLFGDDEQPVPEQEASAPAEAQEQALSTPPPEGSAAAAPAPENFRKELQQAPPLPPEVTLGATIALQTKRQEVLRAEGALQSAIQAILNAEAGILKTVDEEERLQQRADELLSWSYSPDGEPRPRRARRATPAKVAAAPSPEELPDFFEPSCACLEAQVHWIGRSAQAGEAVVSFPQLELQHQTIYSGKEFQGCRARVNGDAEVPFARQTHRGQVELSCAGERRQFTLGKRLG